MKKLDRLLDDAPWLPPSPVLSEHERDEVCARCGMRRGEHIGVGAVQRCPGRWRGRQPIFQPSGKFREAERR